MIHFWYSALASDYGVSIETDDTAALIQRLYAARRKAIDPDLDRLSIVQSPLVPAHVWIVKREPPATRSAEGDAEPL